MSSFCILWFSVVLSTVLGGDASISQSSDLGSLISDLYKRLDEMQKERDQDSRDLRILTAEVETLKLELYTCKNINSSLKDLQHESQRLRSDLDQASFTSASNVQRLQDDMNLLKRENVELKMKLDQLDTLANKKKTYLVKENNVHDLVELHKNTGQNVSSNATYVPRVVLKQSKRPQTSAVKRNAHSVSQRVPEDAFPQSAFFVHVSHDTNPVFEGEIVIFDDVHVNYGGDYVKHTGAFTCRIPGAYFFMWTIEVPIEHRVYHYLTRNGGTVGYGLTSSCGSCHASGTGSNSAIVQLDQGDVVAIKLSSPNQGTQIFQMSSFSGYLLG